MSNKIDNDHERSLVGCRICFEKDETRSKLLTPCLCKGSSKYCHAHCLEKWQNFSLASHKPNKAYICSICCSPFNYPSWFSLAKRRFKYALVYYSNLLMMICSLTWISFIIVPMKLFVHVSMFLLSILLPNGNFNLGTLQITWIGMFPPRLALSRVGEPITELEGGGFLLVASKAIPKSSVFHKSVIVLLEHGVSGSKGVVVNIDSDTLGPQQHIGERDELTSIGAGGPMDNSQYNVFHDSIECSTYSEKLTPKILTNTGNRYIIPLARSDDVFQSKPIFFAEYVQAISVIHDVTSVISSQRKVHKETKDNNNIRKSLSSSILSYIGDWRQSDQELKRDPDLTRVRIARCHARYYLFLI